MDVLTRKGSISDVVVAQSRENMAIWYNMDAPERVTLIPIKGDVVDIVRDDGKTEVIVQEGQHQVPGPITTYIGFF
jgi:intraflagellar transport protein 172